MKTTIKALTLQTEWNGKFSAEDAWWRTCNNHPELFVPTQAKNHEDQRAKWLASQNVKDWLDNLKKFFRDKGYVCDAPGYSCEFFCFNQLYKTSNDIKFCSNFNIILYLFYQLEFLLKLNWSMKMTYCGSLIVMKRTTNSPPKGQRVA